MANLLERDFDGAHAAHATTTVSLCVRWWSAIVEMQILGSLVRDLLVSSRITQFKEAPNFSRCNKFRLCSQMD